MQAITFEGQDIPLDKLPKPTGWRLLIGMIKIEEKSSGGILLVDDHIKKEECVRFYGKVLAIGPGAYQHPKFQGGISLEQSEPKPWCRVGDIVVIGQYAGQYVHCQYNNDTYKLKLINDDEVLATIDDVSMINQ